MWSFFFNIAFAGRLYDFSPTSDDHTTLVIITPGVAAQEFMPIIRALRDDGNDVWSLTLPCQNQDLAAYRAEIAEALSSFPAKPMVVAFGISAPMVLGLDGIEYTFLVAPVLDISDVAAVRALESFEVKASVDLSSSVDWNGQDLATVLVGDLKRTCVSPLFAREMQSWIRDGEIPWVPSSDPVWMSVSLGDNLATIESVIPASRRLRRREIERIGLNSFSGQDFSHGEMLKHRNPIRTLVRAIRRRR